MRTTLKGSVTVAKKATFCSALSSETVNSSALRSGTYRPPWSLAMTGTVTRFVSTLTASPSSTSWPSSDSVVCGLGVSAGFASAGVSCFFFAGSLPGNLRPTCAETSKAEGSRQQARARTRDTRAFILNLCLPPSAFCLLPAILRVMLSGGRADGQAVPFLSALARRAGQTFEDVNDLRGRAAGRLRDGVEHAL